MLDSHHVLLGNSFSDTHHQRNGSLDGLFNRSGSERRRNKNDAFVQKKKKKKMKKGDDVRKLDPTSFLLFFHDMQMFFSSF